MPDLNINAFITGVNNIFVHCTIFLIIFPGVVWPVGVMLHIIKWNALNTRRAADLDPEFNRLNGPTRFH